MIGSLEPQSPSLCPKGGGPGSVGRDGDVSLDLQQVSCQSLQHPRMLGGCGGCRGSRRPLPATLRIALHLSCSGPCHHHPTPLPQPDGLRFLSYALVTQNWK